MHGVALLLTVAALGVDYGWQPGEDGQLEYIIQIEPELVETLREGKVDLLSEIPEELQGVRRFRIRVGKGAVPRKGLEDAQAINHKPGETVANQQPSLPGDPRTQNGTTRPASNFPPARSQPPPGSKSNILLPPPPGGQSGNPNEAPLPNENDRFTGGTGGSFPAVGTAPTINRNASLPRDDRFPASTQTNPNQQQPNKSQFNPADNNNVPLNNGAQQTQQNPNDRWTSAAPTNSQWPAIDDPRGRLPDLTAYDPTLSPVNDPRYRSAAGNNALPEVRRDTNQDPRYADPRYANDPRYAPDPRYADPRYPADPRYAQAPPMYPLRDPDPYLPRDPRYDTVNRQVGYNEVATTRGTGAAAPTTPPAASVTPPATTPTTPTKATGRDSLADDPNSRPWLPLTFTAMLLFASVGLNFYLGWIANGIYLRYRALLMEVRNVRAAIA